MINYAWLPRMHSSARPILWGWGGECVLLQRVWGRREGCCVGKVGAVSYRCSHGAGHSGPGGARVTLGPSPCCRLPGPERGCAGFGVGHQGDSEHATGPPTPEPGLPGSPARPSQATDQGARLVSAWGLARPPPPAPLRSLPQCVLALRRAGPTEASLCSPHRSTRKTGGSGVLRGPTSGRHCRVGGEDPEAGRAPSGVQVWRGAGPGSLLFWGLCLTRPQLTLLPQGPGGGR